MKLRLLAIAILVLLPAAVFGAQGLRTTSAAGVNATIGSYSVATVTIPAIIGIDVETDMDWDFSAMTPPTSATDCTDNTFPPAAGCTSVTYVPTTTTNAGLTAPANGDLWISIFSNKSGVEGALDVTATAPAAFSSPTGFSPQAIRLDVAPTGAAVNGATFGPASPTAIGGSGLALKQGTMSSSLFGWSRIDLTASLNFTPAQQFVEVTGATANVTFTIAY